MLRLTPRQRRMTELVVERLQNKEIALQMGIAGSTVKNTLHIIFENNGIVNRAQLVAAFLTQKVGSTGKRF